MIIDRNFQRQNSKSRRWKCKHGQNRFGCGKHRVQQKNTHSNRSKIILRQRHHTKIDDIEDHLPKALSYAGLSAQGVDRLLKQIN